MLQNQDLPLAGLEAAAPAPSRDWTALRQYWKPLIAAFVVCGCIGYGVSFAFAPRFQSSTLFIPPQQQQGAAASALASLSALSGLVGGSGVKNSADQYISMLQGVTVSDHIIQRFSLATVYDTKFKDDTRKILAKRVQISAGKKDGLIRVDVEDTDPKRAADMANDYVTELRDLTSRLAVTDAQQRRVFFERLLNDTKQRLVAAQVALEGSGFNAGALKAEPR
ncbi:MAG TPA: lipopolysaccharide biosynthesis protein, partial [Burkholderiaceae bacterium]